MTFLNPQFFLLLLIIPGFYLLVFFGRKKNAAWQKVWGLDAGAKGRWSALLWSLSLMFLILALTRPVWDPQPIKHHRSGQETVFLIDVSRSMLTPDIEGQPRLEAVKRAIADLLPDIEGDQLSLVAFAGSTVVKCPLTNDFDYFRESLQMLDPSAISRGGTLVGDALRQVARDFLRPGRSTTVWLFTDGGDQESFPLEAARDFGQAGGRLFVWGIGSKLGGEVPDRQVSSVPNEELLQGMAAAVKGGAYWGIETTLWQLNNKYKSNRLDSRTSELTTVIWQEGSWWLVWPAAALMVLEIVLRRRKKAK